jgi:hypothetical protein
MSEFEDHDHMAELVAVYALDALEGADSVAVEAHLAGCDQCRALLDEHRETAAMLAELAGTEEPPSFDRLAAVIDEPPPPLRSLPGGREHDSDRSADQRSRAAWRRPTVLAAAAAVILALGLGAVLGSLGSSSTKPSAAKPSLSQVAAAAARSTGARTLTLTGTGGAAQGKVILTSSGVAYLRQSNMAPLDAEHTYQVWAVVDGSAISVGLLGSDPGVAAFRVPAHASALAVTAEVAGGVVKSAHQPVASATL